MMTKIVKVNDDSEYSGTRYGHNKNTCGIHATHEKEAEKY